MPKRKPLRLAEKKEIHRLHAEGWTKKQLTKRFHRSFGTLTEILKETLPAASLSNAGKIAVANKLLKAPPANDVKANDVKADLESICRRLRERHPTLQSARINLDTGEIEAVMAETLAFKIGV